MIIYGSRVEFPFLIGKFCSFLKLQPGSIKNRLDRDYIISTRNVATSRSVVTSFVTQT
jgi:hypothetical protein